MDVVEAAECLRREGAEVALHESIKAYCGRRYAGPLLPPVRLPSSAMSRLLSRIWLSSSAATALFLAPGEFLRRWGTRLVGVNLGYLGFLTDIARERMREALSEICQGDYEEESRFYAVGRGGGQAVGGGVRLCGQ